MCAFTHTLLREGRLQVLAFTKDFAGNKIVGVEKDIDRLSCHCYGPFKEVHKNDESHEWNHDSS